VAWTVQQGVVTGMVASGAAAGYPTHVCVDRNVSSGFQQRPAFHRKFYVGLAATQKYPRSFQLLFAS
jgi:hypothetical protein